MIDIVKKTMMAGVGLAVVTQEKVKESLDELVEKGKLSQEEASNVTDKIIEDSKAQAEKAQGELANFFTEMLHKANLVTKDQYEALEARVTELEGKLHKEFPNES